MNRLDIRVRDDGLKAGRKIERKIKVGNNNLFTSSLDPNASNLASEVSANANRFREIEINCAIPAGRPAAPINASFTLYCLSLYGSRSGLAVRRVLLVPGIFGRRAPS